MSGKIIAIVAIVIIVIIVIIAIIAGIYYYNYKKHKKAVATVVVTKPPTTTTTPKPPTTTTTTATRGTARAIASYSGNIGNNRSISIYWNNLTSGLYTLQYNDTLQYGCFSSSGNVLGGSKVMIYEPDYSGVPIAVPDPSICANTFSQPIATMVISAPDATGSVHVTITSVKSSGNNNLSLVSGESFILSSI